MADIRIDAALQHPAERVWRALTEDRLLRQWFTETDLRPEPGSTFHVPAPGLPGLAGPVDGTVVEAEPPHLLVLDWHTGGRPSRTTWELSAAADGCRLRLAHTDLPDGEPERLATLREAYETALGKRLAAALDWLAFRDVDLDAAAPAGPDDATAILPAATAIAPADRPAQSGRRRRIALVVAGTAAAALALAGLVVAHDPRDPAPRPPAAAPAGSTDASATPTAAAGQLPPGRADQAALSQPPATTSPSAAVGGSPSAPPTTPPVIEGTTPPLPAQLGARYETTETGVLTYQGQVTVANAGPGAAPGWQVIVTLAGSATVSSAAGAQFQQDGDTVTFTSTGPLDAGAEASFTFDVDGAGLLGRKRPTACSIGDQPCDGV